MVLNVHLHKHKDTYAGILPVHDTCITGFPNLFSWLARCRTLWVRRKKIKRAPYTVMDAYCMWEEESSAGIREPVWQSAGAVRHKKVVDEYVTVTKFKKEH